MGMDPNGRAGISETQDGIHWCTDPPAFRPAKAYEPADRRQWLGNHWYA